MDSINSNNSDCAVLYTEKAMYLEMIHLIKADMTWLKHDPKTGKHVSSGKQDIIPSNSPERLASSGIAHVVKEEKPATTYIIDLGRNR